MKLNVERLKEDPQPQELGDWVKPAAAESLEGEVQSVAGELFVHRLDRSVFVEGEIHATVLRPCDRCGASVIAVVGGEIDLTYVPTTVESGASREVGGGDMDVGFYTEGSIDLADVLREHCALSTPDRLACDVAAVSLAPGATCQAHLIAKEPEEKPVDSRFSALKGLKLD